jgi:hypothetical protein
MEGAMDLKRAIVITFLLSAPALAETSFYQCKDKWGQPVFSQRPCGEDAIQGSVTPQAESGNESRDSATWDRISADNTIRDAERDIKYREDRIDRLERERDTKIAELKRRSGYANNNLAGAQFQESLATEMQSVNSQYQGKIESEQRTIDRIQAQMERVQEAASN